MPDDEAILHVYGQSAWHDPVYIVGTREGLEQLRAVLNLVLEDAEWEPTLGATIANTSTTDGEGYAITVRVTTEADMDAYALPYTAHYAQSSDGHPHHADWPRKVR